MSWGRRALRAFIVGGCVLIVYVAMCIVRLTARLPKGAFEDCASAAWWREVFDNAKLLTEAGLKKLNPRNWPRGWLGGG